MQRYIFLDLDDTIFQTLRKCPQESHIERLEIRACLPDGTPNSFATSKQQWLWQWLNEGFKIVPVTARDIAAFERVNLPFKEEAILTHGAIILNKHQQIDELWMAKMLANLPNYYRQLLEIWNAIEVFTQTDPNYKCRLVEDFGIVWYGVVKHRTGSETPLRLIVDEILANHPNLLNGKFYWHLNGNNLAILPGIIKKEHALNFLLTRYRQEHQELLTFGAGDSKTDAPFMALCDYALIPTNTQLFRALNSI